MCSVCEAGSKAPSPPSVAEDGVCVASAVGTVEASGVGRTWGAGEVPGPWAGVAVSEPGVAGSTWGSEVVGPVPPDWEQGPWMGAWGEVVAGVRARCLQVGRVACLAWGAGGLAAQVLVVAKALHPERTRAALLQLASRGVGERRTALAGVHVLRARVGPGVPPSGAIQRARAAAGGQPAIVAGVPLRGGAVGGRIANCGLGLGQVDSEGFLHPRLPRPPRT